MSGKRFSLFLSVLFLLVIFSFAFLPAGVASAARIVGDSLTVSMDAKAYTLKRLPVASGDRYEREGDPSTVFSSKGSAASLTIKGKKYPQYVLIRDTTDDDELVLTVDNINYTMRYVRTASGAKYELPGDPKTFFWSKGQTAYLVIRGKEYAAYDMWLPSGTIWLPGMKSKDLRVD
ncbi:MAG: MliC family protein [Synergistaceae bacterium]|jgi:membrane-bound inhibitor of C-type lysozyme|nr:MliC family protein [Synergistaceae bacterium]